MAEQMYPNLIEIAYTPDDAVRIHNSGKLIAGIGIENGWVIGHDLSLIKTLLRPRRALHDARAHVEQRHLRFVDRSEADRSGTGLSPFGRQVVPEMNRVGMMVDVSHVSKECMMQATALSTSPVIGSHSSTTAVANVPRNMDDEMLAAIKKNNGVMQIVAFAELREGAAAERDTAVRALNDEFFGRAAARRGGGGGAVAAAVAAAARVSASFPPDKQAEYDRRMAAIEAKWPSPNVADFVNHIDHAVKVAGIDHVGISSDFDGGGGITGWNDASQTFNVTLELVQRGYSEEDIRKLWGGNALRVMGENQKRAKTEGVCHGASSRLRPPRFRLPCD